MLLGRQVKGMKQLIVNADDLGLSPGVNDGIFQAADIGCVRSATALTGAPFFEQGLAKIKGLDKVGVGIHLNLTGVWDAQSKTTKSCFFRGTPGPLLTACIRGKADLDFVENSLRQQIEAFLRTKQIPTHIDGHHHIHVFPGIAELVARLAKEYGIRKARLPIDGWASFRPCSGALVKRLAVSWMSYKAAPLFKAQGILTSDRFFGFGLMGRKDYDNRFINLLHHLDDGTTEIMTHPGLKEDQAYLLDSLSSEHRAIEQLALSSPEIFEVIESLGIRLTSFADLK